MKFLILLLVVLISESSICQTEVLIPFREVRGGKFGYLNGEGEVVIPAKYREAHNFSKSGYAFVLEDQGVDRPGPPRPGSPAAEPVWKIIDANGSEIEHLFAKIKPISKNKEYSNSRGFIDGKAIVHTDDGFVVLTTNMEVLFKEGYDKIYPFKEGCALAYKDRKWYVLLENGSVNKVEENLKPKRKNFSEGFCQVLETNAGNSMVGCIDTSGKVAIQPKFEDVGNFTGCGLT